MTAKTPEGGISRRRVLETGAALAPLAALPGIAQAAGKEPADKAAAAVPFKIAVPQARLDWIRTRLKEAQWPPIPVDDNWGYGANGAATRELVTYLLDKYDWRAREAAMNKYPQFIAKVDGYDIHFFHVKGSGKNPTPMILSHGWPGTFTEFLKVIEPLTQPEKHGGKAEDSFTVVIPSLPGFGFSSKPAKPIGSRRIGRLFDKLMVEVLGYKSYIAQGGDFGSPISQAMGHDSPNCKAVHLNFLIGVGSPEVTPDEKGMNAKWGKLMQTEGGYIAIQGSKPLTLSYGLTDSPLGTVAWIFEKMKTWSDLQNGDPWSVYSREDVLDNIMVYLVSDTIATSVWMYRGEPDPYPPMPEKMNKPVGVAHFPGELIFWPKSYGERIFNLVRWTEYQKGGHFAALEQPALFVEELRAFKKQVKV